MSRMNCSSLEIINDKIQSVATGYVGFAGFTILVWDHIDTFTMEVEYIWFGEKSLIVYLFLINRYLTPLGFIINLFAYLSPVWEDTEMYVSLLYECSESIQVTHGKHSSLRCRHYIRYEGAMTMIGINIVALMMLIRVYALYSNQFWVLGVVATVFVVEIITYTWLLTTGEAVPHCPHSGVHACTMIFGVKSKIAGSASAWLPLLYDSFVLGFTLHRTWPSLRKNNTNASYMMKRLLEDGLIYYSAIFTVTLILTIMIAAAPDGLKNITAQLELLITVTMMSRITLNLKKKAHKTKVQTNGVELYRLQEVSTRASMRCSNDKEKATVNHIEFADPGLPPLSFSGHNRRSMVRRATFDNASRAEFQREPSDLRFLPNHSYVPDDHDTRSNTRINFNSGSFLDLRNV